MQLFASLKSFYSAIGLVVASQQILKNSTLSITPLNDAFDQLINSALSKYHAPGIAVAVIDGNDTWAKGYGFATLPSTPVTAETLFFTGSTTKAFTAAALSMLIDESNGTLGWSTPVSSLIRDDFVLQDDYSTAHITLEDALSHRTGMPRHDFSWSGKPVKEIVRSLRHLPLSREIRTQWQYCNLMFVVVSHVIETLTGTWLGDYFKERIWHPLGMNGTFFRVEDAEEFVKARNHGAEKMDGGMTSLAHGYWWDNTTKSFKEIPYMDQPGASGAGQIISNVLDYSKWIRAMMSRSGPISAAAHATLVAPHSIMLDSQPPLTKAPIYYGLGWMSTTIRDERLVFHSGSVDGFVTNVAYLPDRQWGVVTMCNGNDIVQQIAWVNLLWDYLDVPEEERADLGEIYTNAIAQAKQMIENAPTILYPSTPSPPLPPSLPLRNYTGTYTHPAYPALTVKINSTAAEPVLYVKMESPLAVRAVLHHISGENFLAYASITTHSEDETEMVLRARFEVGPDGVVGRLGAEIEPSMQGSGKDLMTWWERSE